MIQKHRDRDVSFAVLREFRPVMRNRGVQIQQAARGKQMRAESRRALGAGEYDRDCIRRPVTAVKVNDNLAFQSDAHRRTNFTAVRKVRFELLPDRLKSGMAKPCDLQNSKGEFGARCRD